MGDGTKSRGAMFAHLIYVILIVNAAKEILAFVDGMVGPSTRAARIGDDGCRALQSSRARMVRVF